MTVKKLQIIATKQFRKTVKLVTKFSLEVITIFYE